MKRIAIDKAAHALGGWALVATLLPYTGLWWALLACAALALAKEEWDQAGNGTYDKRDFWATNAGGVAAILADALLVFITQLWRLWQP
jgi:hypothetical protein